MYQFKRYYDELAKLIQEWLAMSYEIKQIQACTKDPQDSSQNSNTLETLLDNENASVFLRQKKWNPFQLSVLITKLDQYAHEQYKKDLDLLSFDFDDTIQMNGLNSEQNQKETDILLIPRSTCIWEGKSGQANHRESINELLRYCCCVELKNGLVDGKYQIKNHVLLTGLYGISLDQENELSVTMGLSPVTEHISLEHDTYTRKINNVEINYFSVRKHGVQAEKFLVDAVKKIIKKADAFGSEIFVFPEMLGTENMRAEVSSMLQTEPLKNMKFFVLPSVWFRHNNIKEAKNTNKSCVMNYCGDVLFEQDKLKEYTYQDQNDPHSRFIEDIVTGSVIHMIHAEGFGSAAVLICRSMLDTDMRTVLMQKLNVRLLLCPSWTPGSSYEFKTSFMHGAECCCNTVWCNTCSALRHKKDPKKEVGIITGYGKNMEYSQLNLDGRIFPAESICDENDNEKNRKLCLDRYTKSFNKRICRHHCADGCIFQEKIYGTDYEPEEEEEMS